MTALCGGGASGPQSGVQTVIQLSAIAIETFISTVLALPEIAPFLAPIIAGTIEIDLASYCSTDPPADPGLTATDVAEALAFPATGQTLAAQQKIVTWFKARYWYQICHCTSTTTPAPPTPSNPGNTSTNPGLPTQAASPCWRVTTAWSVGASTSSSNDNGTDLGPILLPPGTTRTQTVIGGATPLTIQEFPIPVGATNIAATLTMDQPIVHNATSLSLQVLPFNAANVQNSSLGVQIFIFTGVTPATSSVYTQATTPATGYPTWGVWIDNSDTVPHTGTATLSFQCPPGTSLGQPCCPPDPLLQGLLEQILALETAIFEGLPVPLSSFAEGTVHTGLAGLGTVSISPLTVGIKVILTTIPDWVGSAVSDPTFYFDVGFVGFATSEGTYAQQRIEHTPQVFTVPPLGYTVEYTLKNGVVASITELTRGP